MDGFLRSRFPTFSMLDDVRYLLCFSCFCTVLTIIEKVLLLDNVSFLYKKRVCCTGWAKSKDAQLSKPYKDHFLTSLFKALKVDRPLLISASLSGSYVLPYMLLPDPATCSERVSGFVSLAPVSTHRFTHAQYHRCEVWQLHCIFTKYY